MANKGKIDEIIDIQAVEQQISTTNKMLDLTIGRLEKAAGNAAILNETFKNAKGVKAISDAQAILNEEYIKAQKEAENLRKAEERKRKEIEKALAIQEKAAQKERDLIEASQKQAKTIDELKEKIKALTTLRNRYNSETEAGRKAIAEYNKEIDNSKKKLNELGSNEEKRISGIGKYKEGVLAASRVLLGWAAAAGVAVGAAEIFRGIINSTDSISDKFSETMGGAREATKSFFRAIATGDFSNFLTNITAAYEAGVEYEKQLNRIADRSVSASAKVARIDELISEQKLIFKNTALSVELRRKAGEEIKRLEKERLEINKKESNIALEAELANASKLTGLSKKQIQDLVTNYRDYESAINSAGETYKKLQNEAKRYVTDRKTGIMVEIVDNQVLKKLISEQPKGIQKNIKAFQAWEIIAPEASKKISEAIQGASKANTDYNENLVSLLRTEGSLEKKLVTEKEQNYKENLKDLKEINGEKLDEEIDYNSKGLAALDAKNEATKIKENEIQDLILSNLNERTDENLAAIEQQADDDKRSKEQAEEREKAHQEKMKSIREAAFDTVKNIAAGIAELVSIGYENDLQNIDDKSKADEDAKQKELERAGNNQEQKDQINKKYEAREKQRENERKKIERDKAIAQKQAAIFSIILDTAKAIVSHLTTPWLIPFDVATGAIQLAVASAAPIPKYKKGRKGGKGEIAIVGEEGTEAIQLASGKTYLTPDKETMTYLPAGASVIPNHELRKSLAYQSIESNSFNGFVELKNEVKNLQKGFEYVANAYKNKQETHLNITENGFYTIVKNGNSQTTYINNRFKQ